MIKKFFVKKKWIDDNTIEVLKIPVGEPPETGQGAFKDEQGRQKLNTLKVPLMEKMGMPER